MTNNHELKQPVHRAEDLMPADDEWEPGKGLLSIFDVPGFWTRMRDTLPGGFRFTFWKDGRAAKVDRGGEWLGVVRPGRIWCPVFVCGADLSPLPEHLWVISAIYAQSNLLAPFVERGLRVDFCADNEKWLEWRVSVEVPTRAAMGIELVWLSEQERFKVAVEEVSS